MRSDLASVFVLRSFNKGMKLVFKILGRSANGITEIDEAETKEEAEELKSQYATQYSGMVLFIKSCRG